MHSVEVDSDLEPPSRPLGTLWPCLEVESLPPGPPDSTATRSASVSTRRSRRVTRGSPTLARTRCDECQRNHRRERDRSTVCHLETDRAPVTQPTGRIQACAGSFLMAWETSSPRDRRWIRCCRSILSEGTSLDREKKSGPHAGGWLKMDLGGARLRGAGGGGSQVGALAQVQRRRSYTDRNPIDRRRPHRPSTRPWARSNVCAGHVIRSSGRCDVHSEAYRSSGGRRRRNRLVGVRPVDTESIDVDDVTELALGNRTIWSLGGSVV